MFSTGEYCSADSQKIPESVCPWDCLSCSSFQRQIFSVFCQRPGRLDSFKDKLFKRTFLHTSFQRLCIFFSFFLVFLYSIVIFRIKTTKASTNNISNILLNGEISWESVTQNSVQSFLFVLIPVISCLYDCYLY